MEVVLIHSETYNGYLGEIREEITLTMRATVQGTAIDERRAREVVYEELASKVGQGYQIRSGSLSFRRGEVIAIDTDRRITFIMQASGDVAAAIDPAHVVEMTRGASLREALLRLDRELPLASPPQIEVWPPFWPLMPVLPFRTTVQIEGQL
jgi:hypothetical protein